MYHKEDDPWVNPGRDDGTLNPIGCRSRIKQKKKKKKIKYAINEIL